MRWKGCLALTVAVALSGGCATRPDDGQGLTVYRLQLPADAPLPDVPTADAVLAIESPDAPAVLRTRDIAYQPEQHQLRYYSRSQWADPPPRMLETALVSAFERSQLFRGVVRSSAAGRPDYRLGTELLRLEHDFSGSGGSRLALTMRVQLTDLKERALLGSKVIEVHTPAPSDDAEGAVRAAHQALAQAMSEAVGFAAETLAATRRD